MSAIVRWFLSPTVRQAVDLRRQVQKLLHAQRDILATEAVQAIEGSMAELRQITASGADKKTLLTAMEATERVANQWLKPYPHASLRENIEVVLVAIVVAMGVRTFFLQPFKIPTGSMQPTLYGITHENHRGDPNFQVPGGLQGWMDSWFRGISYYHVVAEEDGEFVEFRKPRTILPFVSKQQFRVGNVWYTVWFPPEQLFGDYGSESRAGLTPGQTFRKGDDILKLKVITGDHLFVDRLTYNFRRPRRGEIIVFETKGIAGLPQDQFYIKRMVALGDERVRIGNDRHLRINDERLDSATPRFENVYHFKSSGPERNELSGHVNEFVARANGRQNLAARFPDETQEFKVRPDHYLVMGDNTLNSYDSRAWGDFSRTNVIGKSCFVYWPFSSPTGGRFGWSHR